VGWAANDVAWPIPAAPETSAPALGKRRRDESHGDSDKVPAVVDSHEMPPQIRVRGGKANGILKTAQSATTTRQMSATRIPKTRINSEPKQPVRGAERLASPDSQGLHRRSLLGPSVQQGWAEEAADGQLIWVEGSVEETVHRIDDAVQQQQQEEGQQQLFEIPKDLKTGHRALLLATPAKMARGTIREIRCRLCTKAKFEKWGAFKRHCDTAEAHPLKIYFCETCGMHFARSDSRQRHHDKQFSECLLTRPEEADEKRRQTQREHVEFLRRLKGHSTGSTGEEEIRKPFWKTIKDMFPGSSKKHLGGSGE
jgi:hypothetical protein